MISAEVPVMFSKAIEFFITELTLRAWLHTEEGKRRTIQVCSQFCDRKSATNCLKISVQNNVVGLCLTNIAYFTEE